MDLSAFSGETGSRVLSAALLVLLVIGVGSVAHRLVTNRVADVDLRYRSRKAVMSLTWILAAIAAISQFVDAFEGLGAALGIAGAGVAFALQEVIASAAGWLGIQFGGLYKVGERVQLGGIKGDVIDVGMLRTTLMEVGQWVDGDLYNGRVVRVANSFVFKEPVFNYSAGFPFLWDEVRIPVKYGCDAKLARSSLHEIADGLTAEWREEARSRWARMVRDFRLEDARLEPIVSLALNDNWMEFTVRYLTHYQRRRMTRDALFQRILEAFDASGGRLAFASATFQLVEAPPIEVTLRPTGEPTR